MATEENNVVKKIMVAASRLGNRLFRNNVGYAKYPGGVTVKYGVCNPGGSDNIGWTRVMITEAHVGMTLAVFTAVEAKTPAGTVTKEQENFINLVNSHGGIAFVARCEDDYLRGILQP